MRKLIIISLIAVFVIITAGMSHAQDEVIYACSSAQQGNLRVVQDLSECRSSETKLTWNVQGPQGPPGPTGIQGDPGVIDLDKIYMKECPDSFGCFCDGADVVVGGGAVCPNSHPIMEASQPMDFANGWNAACRVLEPGPRVEPHHIRVICIER